MYYNVSKHEPNSKINWLKTKTTKTMEESNKLIAEFMGINLGEYTTYPEESPKQYAVNELEYHYSWDWLMPVVEKIENFGYEFIIVESRCYVKHNTDHSIKTLFYIETIGSKLKTTYDAVVEFIKNQNN